MITDKQKQRVNEVIKQYGYVADKNGHCEVVINIANFARDLLSAFYDDNEHEHGKLDPYSALKSASLLLMIEAVFRKEPRPDMTHMLAQYVAQFTGEIVAKNDGYGGAKVKAIVLKDIVH